MAVEGHRDPVITERSVPLADYSISVLGTRDWIPETGNTNTTEFHSGRPRCDRTAVGGFITDTNNSFHRFISLPLIFIFIIFPAFIFYALFEKAMSIRNKILRHCSHPRISIDNETRVTTNICLIRFR